MRHARRSLFASLLASLLGLAVAGTSLPAFAKDPKDLVIGTSAGPYADQVRFGIKPILEKSGWSNSTTTSSRISRWQKVRSTPMCSSTSST
jgi:ABC-type sugar transport system substrate-binding protein